MWSVTPDSDAGQSCVQDSLPTSIVYCTVLWDTSGGADLIEVPAAVRKGIPPTSPAHRLSPDRLTDGEERPAGDGGNDDHRSVLYGA